MLRTAVVDEFHGRWGLSRDGRPVRGHNALIQPVRTPSGTPAMLRIGDPRGDSATAWIALRCWAGDGAVRMYRFGADRDVLLLERLETHRDLDSLPIGQAIEVAAVLRARLIRPAPDGVPTLRAVTADWVERLRAADHILPNNVADRAAAMCRELLADAEERYLVNSDLHYRNVLAGERAPWLVIDPMPVAADREFGIASLVWGRSPESRPGPLIRSVVQVGGLDLERTVAWTFVETAEKLLTAAEPVARRCRAVLDDLSASTSSRHYDIPAAGRMSPAGNSRAAMTSRRVVFWDFDGTLAQRDGMWPEILHDAIRTVDPQNAISAADLAPQLRQGFPIWKPGQLRVFPDAAAWWASASITLIDACRAVGLDPATAERAVAQVPRIYYRPGSWRIMPVAVEALTATSAAGLTNVILSNHAPELPELVDALGLAPLVERTITSASLGAQKPDPFVFRAALRLTGAASDSWLIGDNPIADVQGAQAVGMRAVLVHCSGPDGSLSLVDAAASVIRDLDRIR